MERTVLITRYASGTTLAVLSTSGWSQNDICVVGRPGQEATEAKDVSSTTGATTITVSGNLLRSHPIDTHLFLSQFDQIEFERKESGGAFAALSDSPFTIEWDEPDSKTKIIIPSFVTTDTLRWRFRNSASGDVSSYSDEVPGTGISRSTVATPLHMVLATKTGKKYIDDPSQIIDFFNDLHDEVEEQMPLAWFLENDDSTDLVEASVYKYPLPASVVSVRFVLYRDFQGQEYPLTFVQPIEMRNFKIDTTQVDDDSVRFWSFFPPDSSSDVGYIAVHPTPKTAGSNDDGKLTFVMTKALADVDSQGDTIPIPNPKVYFEYAMYRIFQDLEEDNERAQPYQLRYLATLKSINSRLQRQRGQQQLFKFKGQSYYSRLFGDKSFQNIDTLRENRF